jgi:hypothetical protein
MHCPGTRGAPDMRGKEALYILNEAQRDGQQSVGSPVLVPQGVATGVTGAGVTGLGKTKG